MGVLTTLGLWWLDVPLALTFGLLAAALTFIPNLGPPDSAPHGFDASGSDYHVADCARRPCRWNRCGGGDALTAAAMTMVRMLYAEDLLEDGQATGDLGTHQ